MTLLTRKARTFLSVVLVALVATFVLSRTQDRKAATDQKDQAQDQTRNQKENTGGDTERERVEESGDVLKQIHDTPDKTIPKGLLNGAKCVIVLPSVKKFAIGVGGTYGRRVMTCRSGQDFKRRRGVHQS